MRLPVHAGGPLIEHLQPVAAAVAFSRVRIFGEHHGKRDEAACVLRPAMQNRQFIQREVIASDHFLARAIRHDLRKERAHLGQFGKHLQLAQQTFGHAHFQILRDARGNLLHRVHLQRDLHFARARKTVDEHRNIAALGLLEQQRGSAILHGPIREFGDFEIRINFERDALQLVVFFKRGDEVAQVAIRHKECGLPWFYYDGKSGSMTNRTAFITGASRGIGRACAIALSDGGACVAVGARNMNQLEELAEELRSRGREVFPVPLDLSSAESIKEAFAKTAKDFGAVGILVNNAGITKDGLALRMKKDDWDTVLATNLTGAFLAIQQVLQGMMRERWGRIINISSVVGETGNPGQANYVASKAGLIGLTKSIAREMGSRNITVNAVAPGFIETDMTAGLSEDLKNAMLAQVPLKRLGRAEDVAAAVRFLASEDAAYITGHVLDVNGGAYM